ncbi:hypothetical protein BDP27DRAFT_1425999 [Rhodocollybia butyracea]|uniref:Uncharacterized protein n=1 Tax=Rhodocollybia butyracea TaxID=206335 RepID=A0A9P5PJ62_9AGAR|nr:hypothetical protein BDP27DRAFT_1425999 [Rhodocollybia butyracea]
MDIGTEFEINSYIQFMISSLATQSQLSTTTKESLLLSTSHTPTQATPPPLQSPLSSANVATPQLPVFALPCTTMLPIQSLMPLVDFAPLKVPASPLPLWFPPIKEEIPQIIDLTALSPVASTGDSASHVISLLSDNDDPFTNARDAGCMPQVNNTVIHLGAVFKSWKDA